MKHGIPLLTLTLLIGGCTGADTARYPSLLPRPIEARSDAEPTAPPPAAAVADPALDAKLAGYAAVLDKTEKAFAPAADHAEAAARAAQGQAVGSDHWLDAQTALAELDTYRSDLSAMLTDVEQLAIDRAAAGEPDYPGVEQLRDKVKAAFDAESARIGAIQAMLPAA
ncbi:MAG: hypothetical protein V4475_09455 [Pseudomonadota bacterium]